jgi:anti-sigma regulatory factor (Ser/Thr protein kinase)
MTMTCNRELQRRSAVFPASLGSAREARRFVEATLEGAGVEDPALSDRLTLATSELVTNAVVHARSEVEVRITVDDDVVWLEVADRSASLPERMPPSVTSTHGRGLVLVDALAGRWGVAPASAGRGKSVWVEVSRACTSDASGLKTRRRRRRGADVRRPFGSL